MNLWANLATEIKNFDAYPVGGASDRRCIVRAASRGSVLINAPSVSQAPAARAARIQSTSALRSQMRNSDAVMASASR